MRLSKLYFTQLTLVPVKKSFCFIFFVDCLLFILLAPGALNFNYSVFACEFIFVLKILLFEFRLISLIHSSSLGDS